MPTSHRKHIETALRSGVSPSGNIIDGRSDPFYEIGAARTWRDWFRDFSGMSDYQEIEDRIQRDLDEIAKTNRPISFEDRKRIPAVERMLARMDQMMPPEAVSFHHYINRTPPPPSNFLNLTATSTPSKTTNGRAKAGIDESVIDTILKEAVPGDLEDAKMIASVVANRARLTGQTWKSIVEARDQITAAARKGFPPGVNTAEYRSVIEQAVDDVLTNGPVTEATYYATPNAQGNLPRGLKLAGTTSGHVYKTDPRNRPLVTSAGTITPREPGQEAATSFKKGLSEVAGKVRDMIGTTPEGQKGKPSRSRGLQDVADVTKGAWTTTSWSNVAGVDKRLTDILSTAAGEFVRKNPGYSVQAFSGKRGRSTGTRNHPTGRAIDVNIIDPTGAALPNKQNGKSFPTYQAYANIAKDIQHRNYPELDDKFAWGGYFHTGGTPLDQMHFDISGVRGALGSWETGLNDLGRRMMARFGFPDVQSVGWKPDQEIGAPPAEAPIPMARPAAPATAVAQAEPAARVDTAKPAPAVQTRAEALPVAAGPAPTVEPQSAERAALAYAEPVSSAVKANPAAQALERIVGVDVTGAGFPAKPETVSDNTMPAKAAEQVAKQIRAAVSATATPEKMTPTEWGAFAGLQPERVTPETGYERAKPVTDYERVKPITGQAITIPRESLTSINAMVPPQQPEPVTKVATPVQTKTTLSPMADYETQVGTEPVDDVDEAPVVKRTPAPALPPPVEVKELPIAPPAPPVSTGPSVSPVQKPALTPADIYGGAMGVATASDGNKVSRDAYGRTAVTNKYGVTTVTLPDGRQAASNQKGPLSKTSISNPIESLLGGEGGKIDKNKVGGMLLGGVLGALVGGPAGAIGGASLGNRIANPRPGSLIERMFREYPDKPKSPSGYTEKNIDFDRMRSISPDAADAISKGLGGLF